jgi:hypothetical protein
MMAAKLKKQGGSVLVMAVVLSLVTIFLGVSFLTLAVTLHNQTTYEIASAQALYDSFAGALKGACDWQNGRYERGTMREFYKDNFNGFKIIGFSNLEGSPPTTAKVIGYGRSTFMENDITKEVILNIVPFESFAAFAYLSNSERDPMRLDRLRFATPDTFDGKVHSNDSLYILGQAVFRKRVTSSHAVFTDNHARFDQGKGIRPPIEFQSQSQRIRSHSKYDWGTQGHDSLTQIALSDSLIYMRKCGKILVDGIYKIHCSPAELGANSFPIPLNGAIFVKGKVWISAARGRVDRMDGEFPEDSFTDGNFISEGFSGNLTIGTSDTMIIVDNLVYKHSRPNYEIPTVMDSCSDLLGLVSENYIMVGRLVSDTVYIHAAMTALRGAFSIQDIYYSQPPGWDNEKQSLFIRGSLAQFNRGILHTSEPNGHRRGFIEKEYDYDTRLENQVPPFYPIASEGEMVYLELNQN